MRGDLAGLSVWSDFACEGGTNLGELVEVSACTESWDVETGWSLDVTLGSRDANVGQVARRRALRLELADGTWREYRIAAVRDARESGGATVEITGQDPRLDLAERVLLSTEGIGGIVYFDDGRIDFTPTEYVDLIVSQAQAQGVAVSRGTITPTVALSLEWQRATGLALLQQLVEAIRARGIDVELDVRRNGTTDYLIDLVTQIGSSATAPELHVGRHLTGWQRQRAARDQASRVVPFGGVDGTGAEATIARAGWLVTAKSTNVLTLEDPAGGAGPVQFTSQHDDPIHGDWYLQASDGTLVAVTASSRTSATQSSVTVADGSKFSVGDVVEVRATSTGRLLTSLVHPTYIQAPPTGIGEKLIPLARPALRGERNLIPNPWGRTWTVATDPPDDWDVVELYLTVAKTREVPADGHVAFGPYGLRVASLGSVRVSTPTGTITPVDGATAFTVSLSLWVFALQNDLQITVYTTPPLLGNRGVYIVPVANVPLNTRWDLTIANIQLPLHTTQVRLDLVAHGIVDLLVDAVQVTQTPQAADAFVEHSRANALWQAANDYLADFGDPPAEFTGHLLDYYRQDPAAWAALAVVPGVTTRVIDDARGLDLSVRAVQLTWNRLLRGDTRIRWSSRPRSFTAAATASLGAAALLAGGTTLAPNAPGSPGNSTPAPVGTAPLPTGTLVYPFYAPGTQTTFTNLPAAETERTDDVQGWVVLEGYAWARLEAHVQTAASQGQLVAKYKTSPSGPWRYLDGVSGPVLDLTASGTVRGDDVAIEAAAQGDVIVALFEAGGNGTDDPVVGHVLLHVHNGAQRLVPTGCPLTRLWPQRDDWTRYASIADLYAFAYAHNSPALPLQYGEVTWYHGQTVDANEQLVSSETWHGHPVLKAFYGAGGFEFMPAKSGVPGHNELKAWPTSTEGDDFWMRQRIKIPAGFTTPNGRHTLFEIYVGDNYSIGFTKDGGTDKVAVWKNYATGTETVVGTASVDVIGAGWIEVGFHYVQSGGVATVDFYLGTPCSNLASLATVSGGDAGGVNDSIAVNNFEHDLVAGQFFYLGDWEMVPSSIHSNPFGWTP